MSDATPINDLPIYLERMGRSVFDKLFAFDVGAHIYVDFGCADGALLKLVARLFPENTYYGYDKDPKMIEEARREGGAPNLVFTHNWGALATTICAAKSGRPDFKACLLLFSVIHEIYSYDRDAVAEFWKTVFGQEQGRLSFDYVVIRDMAVSKSASRPSDPITVARVRQLADRQQLSDWEAHWGSISENWSLTHFLLTYHYKENWERELRENYLPVSVEDLLHLFPRSYSPAYVSHYSLPFIRKKVRKDFDLDFQEPTHFKLVMERRSTT